MLAGILESFRAKTSEASFTVFSSDPDSTTDLHKVAAAPRMSWSAVNRVLRDSDLLLSGGGSLLQDVTSLRSLVYYLWVVRAALSLGRPVMFYAQGIGPLRSRAARTLTRMIANRVQLITVRDQDSAALLKHIGVTKPPIEVTADPAFGLSPAPSERAREILEQSGADPDRAIVGFAIRPWSSPAIPIESYAELARRILELDKQVVFLPMQPPGDLALSESIASKVPEAKVIGNPLTPAEALAVTGSFSGLVAMRLHALIFGAMSTIPMLALGYDPKVNALMFRLGQAYSVIPLQQFEPESAASRLAERIENGESIRQMLRTKSNDMRALNQVNVDRALALIRP